MGIPLLLSIAMLGGWLLRKDKRWSRQHSWLAALDSVLLVISVPMAINTYSAYMTMYGMAVIILCASHSDAIGHHVEPEV